MQYNQLGKAGIRLSEIGLGSWITFGKQLDLATVKDLVHAAFERGIIFFDTAESYAHGEAEVLLGKAIQNLRREDVVISTKLFWGGNGPNDTGLSRKHILEGCKNALSRLRLDYVDLLFCHRPDPHTPIEETVLAMDYLIRQGYALYWGTSEWDPEQIKQAFAIAADLHCHKPSAEQPIYNLFSRHRIEHDYMPLFEEYELGTTTWSPLASGILSGKYANGIPQDSRLAKETYLIPANFQQLVAKTRALAKIAGELDCTLAQLAIAWCLKNPHVSSVIIGATKKAQLLENIDALKVKAKLTADVLFAINQTIKNDAHS